VCNRKKTFHVTAKIVKSNDNPIMTKSLMVLLLFLISCQSQNNYDCVDGNCDNGVGTRLWKDGGYERGSWKSGKLNGQGLRFFGKTSNFAGDTYNGEFKDGKYNGKGTYYDMSEDATYVGDWENGHANGFGTLTYGTNSKFPNQYYKGEWKDGKRDGFGTQFFGSDGKWKMDKYVGDWKNDKMDGIGKYLYASGDSYEGHWQNDLRQGDGVQINNGKVIHVYCDGDSCETVKK
jgi:hypothetical protein